MADPSERTGPRAGPRTGAFEEQVLESLAHLSRRVDSLIGEIGRLKGRALEQRVRDETGHFLRGLLSRARIVELEDMLERIAAGSVGADGIAALERVDLIAEGVLRGDSTRHVHLVAEISWRIDAHDVHRAHERARILAEGAGYPCLPAVVADDEPTFEVIRVASELGVAVVDGDGIIVSAGRVVEA